MRLFASNSPAFVNVSDLRSSVRILVDNVGSRLRCEEHGLKHAECVKCLDTDSLLTTLRLDPTSKTFTKQNADDLSVLLVHQILYFESMCVSMAEGCSHIDECEKEVLAVMGRYANPAESLVKVLRVFKLYLKEETDKECFSAQDILEGLPPSNYPKNEVIEIRQAFSIMMGLIFEGRCIGIGESVTDFLDDIFHHYGDNCSPYMSVNGLKRLMHDLQSGQGSDHDHDHHHSHHHDNDHDDSHNCNHKHAHFSHYHDGHYHSPPSHLIHNDSRGYNEHHDHDHFGHDHDHPYHSHPHEVDHHNLNHDHDHSNHDHDHDHSHHDHDHFHHEFNHSIHNPSEHHSDFEHNHTHSDMDDVQLSGIHSSISSAKKNESENFASSLLTTTSLMINTAKSSTMNLNNDESLTLPPSTTTSETSVPASTTIETSTSTSRANFSSIQVYITTTDRSSVSIDGDRSEERMRRSTSDQTKFSGPFSSLRSDLSHQEEDEKLIEETTSTDDVKKVYLLQNDQNRDTNLELSGTPHQFASLAAKCLTAEQLIAKFGLRENGTLTKGDFVELCPALVQQVVSGVCTDSAPTPAPLPSRMEVYGYGSLSVFIITLTSLAGVLLLPIMTKMAYNYIIAGFYGLAFSTLAADALLHLMPQFLGLHSHGSGDSDHGHSHDSGVLEPYAQLQLGVFFTIYALFLFEAIMGAFSGGDGHSQENKSHGHSHGNFPDQLPTLISVKSKSEVQLNVSRDQSNTSLDTEIIEVESIKKPPNLMVSKPVFLGLTSMAIVVTLGDSMHNFGDGLAIGAAFSTGVRGGLSTAIAVFCHEVPHEFGDFVVLLSTGLSFSKALFLNFVSGLTCFAGLYIGIHIGDNELARKWVMAVTAGIFLYVALGEMLPELREHTKGSRVVMLIIKNLGILAGLGIMLLISVYESQIA